MHSLRFKPEKTRDLVVLVAYLLEHELAAAPQEAELDLDSQIVKLTVVSAIKRGLDLHSRLCRPVPDKRLADCSLTP